MKKFIFLLLAAPAFLTPACKGDKSSDNNGNSDNDKVA